MTEEHKKKISGTLKGRPLSEETKRKMSASRMGHKISEETRKKISAANKGKHHGQSFVAPEVRLRISRTNLNKKPCWIFFYLWRDKGNPVYVGHTRNIAKREKKHRSGETVFDRTFLKENQGCTIEDLELRVWDISLGKWAIAIEAALIKFYETRFPSGQNKSERIKSEKDLINCGLGGSFKRTRQQNERHSQVMKDWWLRRKNGATLV